MTKSNNMERVQTPLSKSLLAGLATGIIAIIANLLFDFIYRSITKLSLAHSIINVETIIFFSIISGVVAGLLFHFFVYTITKGTSTYVAVAVILTIAAIAAGFAIKRGDENFDSSVFRMLYDGIIIITGVCISFLLPWFTRHKNPFFNVITDNSNI